jgi:hypothetical protein
MSKTRSSVAHYAKAAAATIGVAILMVGLTAPASVAAATVTRGTIVEPLIPEQGIPDDCRPGITGSIAGTHTLDFHSVETSHGSKFIGTATDVVKLTWSDGSYTLGQSVDHFTFINGSVASVNTNAHVDSGDTYSADGVFLYRTTFHLVHHYTLVNGEFKSQFETDHIHFFGGPCG